MLVLSWSDNRIEMGGRWVESASLEASAASGSAPTWVGRTTAAAAGASLPSVARVALLVRPRCAFFLLIESRTLAASLPSAERTSTKKVGGGLGVKAGAGTTVRLQYHISQAAHNTRTVGCVLGVLVVKVLGAQATAEAALVAAIHLADLLHDVELARFDVCDNGKKRCDLVRHRTRSTANENGRK